jgi:hypothetical protein
MSNLRSTFARRFPNWSNAAAISDESSQTGEWSSPKVAERDGPVVFMHVPKTSGVAISSGLRVALAPERALDGHDHCLFGSFANFETIAESIQRTIYESPAGLPQDADFVGGHFAFSTLWDAYPAARRITLLREPYSRLMSHWLFWRQHTDMAIEAWGSWADRVRKSRLPLVEFLTDPLVACQTDNLMLRMLLWPHPLVPADQFINPVNDKQLLREAMARLLKFDFVDIVEDPGFAQRLRSWIGRSFEYGVHNETSLIPREFRSPLHRELTSKALELLDVRSRLDLALWTRIAMRHLSARDGSRLREHTILANVARYSVLMAP